MGNIIKWILQSSADPTKLALTVRGLLVGIIPTVIALAPFFGIDPVFVQDWIGQFADAAEKIVFLVFSLVAAVMVAWGLFRKIILTLKSRYDSK